MNTTLDVEAGARLLWETHSQAEQAIYGVALVGEGSWETLAPQAKAVYMRQYTTLAPRMETHLWQFRTLFFKLLERLEEDIEASRDEVVCRGLNDG